MELNKIDKRLFSEILNRNEKKSEMMFNIDNKIYVIPSGSLKSYIYNKTNDEWVCNEVETREAIKTCVSLIKSKEVNEVDTASETSADDNNNDEDEVERINSMKILFNSIYIDNILNDYFFRSFCKSKFKQLTNP
jgi:hypothetical protein